MFKRKPNIEAKLTLSQCKTDNTTVEAQLIWANIQIKALEATIESLHLNHELAHYTSMFIARSTGDIIYNSYDDNMLIFIRDNIRFAKLFIKEMRNENKNVE